MVQTEQIQNLINKFRAFWSSLPHQVQALILAFASAAGTAFIHAVEDSGCFTVDCLRHYAASAIGAGVVAARVFYMVPNRAVTPLTFPTPPTPPGLPPTQAL